MVKDADFPKIEKEVEAAMAENPSFRLMKGKKVFEILPKMEWEKGKALMRIMKTLSLDWKTHNIVYIGDDTTDEDAFRVIRGRGVGIIVSNGPGPSFADFFVHSVDETAELFSQILEMK